MSEKESSKRNIGTIICIIIIFLLIIALGLLYYFGLVKQNQEISTLKSEQNTFKNEITTLQEKNKNLTNSINETITNSEEKQSNIEAEKTSNDDTDSTANKNLPGNYTASISFKDDHGNSETATYNLTLYENGTYQYEYEISAPFGSIGNYYIDNNKLILNQWFATNSSAEMTAINGQIELTLNQDGTISDTNHTLSSIKVAEASNVKLKKESGVENISDPDIITKKTQTCILINSQGFTTR